MAIRKEQVLVLLVAAFGGWVWYSRSQEAATGPVTARSTMLEYKPGDVRPAPLAGAGEVTLARRDLCSEPSDTKPLPPRELAFPPRAPLALAMLPLEPGPDYRHLGLLLGDGGVVDGVTLTAPGEGGEAGDAAAGGGDPQGTGGQTREEKLARAERSYDKVFLVNQAAPFYGIVEWNGIDPFELEQKTDLSDVVVRLRRFNVDTQKVEGVVEYGKDAKVKVDKVRLAPTRRNEVTRHIRAVPELPSHNEERGELIRWLLEQAREESWIYAEALKQAQLFMQLNPGNAEGVRWQQRVLQASGEIAEEFRLLSELQGPQREAAFRYQGLGVIEARLGLFADAERDLRRAVELGPTDAGPHAALAMYLHHRGNSKEALAEAERAQQRIGSLLDPVEKARAVRAMVTCQLATGRLEQAREVLRMLPADGGQGYLDGCLLYAQGELDRALAAFRQSGGASASSGGDRGSALLGQAACLLRQGQWQQAQDLFLRVLDQEPLLRHRAATGLALLANRIGQFDQAIVWLDRALEADPADPYAHYLRGRTLRQQGQLGAARESLTNCLKLRDDFVMAISEMSQLQSRIANDSSGEDQAQALLAAQRYADRACDLAPQQTADLHGLQGLQHFAAGDVRGAGAAFAKARDLAVDERAKAYGKGAIAVVDYSRGLVDEAVTVLQRLVLDLPKDDVLRQWAEATLLAIEEHAKKEMLEDAFERGEVGSLWVPDRDGAAVEPKIKDNELVFQGTLQRTGDGEVGAKRLGAVLAAKNFLAVSCTLQLGPTQPQSDGFAGLRIELPRGNGPAEFVVELGIREGQPFFTLRDGRDSEAERLPLAVPGFALRDKQQLELRVVPIGDAKAASRALELQVSWNGAVVQRRELKALTSQSRNELTTTLFASGTKGSPVDVRFGDYRLERKKE